MSSADALSERAETPAVGIAASSCRFVTPDGESTAVKACPTPGLIRGARVAVAIAMARYILESMNDARRDVVYASLAHLICDSTMRIPQKLAVLFTLLMLLPHASHAQDSPSPQPQEGDFETVVTLKVRMNYLLYLPERYDEESKWPLVVFLHGAGERGDDLEKVKVHGPPRLIESGHRFPFIVLAPQCKNYGWWYGDAVAALTRQVADQHKVDRDRIYLTGLSMGGGGTWSAVAKHPDLYAAIAPICGAGGNPEDAEHHKHVPAWVFHGARDRAVPLSLSERMVKALRAAGGDVKFTIYPEAEHDSWTAAYNTPELFEWMLSQHR